MQGNNRRVGYVSPPLHTRWRKGQSGNPQGRPKGAAVLPDTFRRKLAERVPGGYI